METNQSLTPAEFKELETFFDSDSVPPDCMDISQFDGFLTGLVVGPEMVVPSQWLPEILGETGGNEMVWESKEQLERILSLIMAHYNYIAGIFSTDPDEFAPLLYFSEHKGQEITFIDMWCTGFMQAVDINLASWQPMIRSDKFGHLLLPFYLNGSEEGWEQLEHDPKLKEIPQEVWIEALYEFVPLIYEFWHPNNEADRLAHQQANTTIPGRNDPCPCGSGKKFKYCCGQPSSAN